MCAPVGIFGARAAAAVAESLAEGAAAAAGRAAPAAPAAAAPRGHRARHAGDRGLVRHMPRARPAVTVHCGGCVLAAVEAVEVVLVPLVQRGHGPRGGDGARDGDPEAGHAADAGPEPAGLLEAAHHGLALGALPLGPALPGLPLAAAAAGRRLQSSPLLLTPHLSTR